MKNKKLILVIMLLVIVLVAGGIVYYYWDQGQNYVSTEDARLAANIVPVTPLIPGKITSWNVNEGQMVKDGETLGWQDTNSLAQSASVNAYALNQVGSVSVDKAEITAPISGQIIKSSVETGQMTAPGQTLAMIADTSDLYVSANIKETSIDKVKIGQDVEVSIDALEGKTVMGKVEEIGNATTSTFSILPQSSGGSFTKVIQLVPIKIRFPGINKLGLIPGESVEIKIHIGTK